MYLLYRKLTSVFKVYTLCWDRRETDSPLENMGKVQSNMDKAHITTKVAGKQVLRVLSPDRKNTGRKAKIWALLRWQHWGMIFSIFGDARWSVIAHTICNLLAKISKSVWRPQVNLECYFSGVSVLPLRKGLSLGPGACRFAQASQPVRPRRSPVSASRKHTWLSGQVLRTELKSWSVRHKHFMDWVIFPAPRTRLPRKYQMMGEKTLKITYIVRTQVVKIFKPRGGRKDSSAESLLLLQRIR